MDVLTILSGTDCGSDLREGRVQERKRLVIASWARVDEGVHTLGVVRVVFGQRLVGQGRGVARDERAKVVGNGLSLLLGHTALCWGRESSGSGEENDRERLDENHFDMSLGCKTTGICECRVGEKFKRGGLS